MNNRVGSHVFFRGTLKVVSGPLSYIYSAQMVVSGKIQYFAGVIIGVQFI